MENLVMETGCNSTSFRKHEQTKSYVNRKRKTTSGRQPVYPRDERRSLFLAADHWNYAYLLFKPFSCQACLGVRTPLAQSHDGSIVFYHPLLIKLLQAWPKKQSSSNKVLQNENVSSPKHGHTIRGPGRGGARQGGGAGWGGAGWDVDGSVRQGGNRPSCPPGHRKQLS